MTVRGQSGLRFSHVSDPAKDRRATPKPPKKNTTNNIRQLNIATYNVRTLNDSDFGAGHTIEQKLDQLINGCTAQNIDIMCIQEHRQKSPNNDLNEVLKHGWTLAHTHVTPRTCNGVAVLYSKEIRSFVTATEQISDRIIALHLQGNPKVCVICAYAPTDCSAPEAKDTFYHDLMNFISTIPPHTVLILAGDFNARIGKDSHADNRRIVGPYCLYDESNNNGQRMIDLCEANDLRPAHSHFPHPKSRLLTYQNPKGEHFQLDHIMIRTKWWKSIKNCRAYSTINIGSDHKCVTANLRLSLRTARIPPNSRCKYNWSKLKDPVTSSNFNIDLKNRFETLMMNDKKTNETINNEIQRRTDHLEEALRESSEKILGKQRHSKYKSYVTARTLHLIDCCNKAHKKYKSTQRHTDKDAWHQLQGQVSSALKHDQQAYRDEQLEQLITANNRRQFRTTWQIIHQIADDKPKASPDKVRKLDGSLPKNPADLSNDWRTYFSTLLNNSNKHADPANHPAPSEDNSAIITTPITYDEVVRAIESLKRNKSPGPDYAMTAEVLKDGGEFIVQELHTICQLVYEHNYAPKQWTTTLLVPLPKKGNLQLMPNYRGIIFMSIAAKAYNRILLNRICDEIDKQLRPNQAGFRTGKSCIQQIHTLRRIMDEAERKQLPLFITYVDFKKAFDSIDRSMMFAILRHYGIPAKIVDAIRVLYDKSTSQVFIKGQLSEPFDITTGVLQGDVLAPFLFIIVIDYVSKKAAGDFGFLTHKGDSSGASQRTTRRTTQAQRTRDRKLNDLAFADDIALLESILARAQEQLDALVRHAREVGLEVNVSKTEQMRLNCPASATPEPNLTLDGQDIKVVTEFKYLGAYMSSTEKDVQSRIGLTWVAFNKLKSILTSPLPSNNFKLKLFDAACISILLYGCEAWNLTEKMIKQLDIFVRKCYRIILKIKQSEDHVMNDDLYQRAGRRPISEEIRKRQLQFIGHCLRLPDTEQPAHIYALYESNMGKQKVGRLKPTYNDQISKYIMSRHIGKLTAKDIMQKAKDKDEWKALIDVPRKKKPPDSSST